ncbi:DNA polymerase delta, subunit 4-domain-containing protein [Mycena amicta]|nr:DNA polymerase delta, subunit 4-domain-containing protein [Mycena amicta]
MPKAAKPSSSLKQATLSFNASKSTSTTNKGKKRATFSDSDLDEAESIKGPSGALAEKAAAYSTPVKKRALVSAPPKPQESDSESDSDADAEIIDVDEPLDLNPKDKRWNKYARVVKAKRGNLKLIHAEDENVFHDILRVFDTSYEYGPCIGVTRLERWERAEAMGLSPPTEVHDILVSKQGDEYAQSVFDGQV